VYDGEFETKLQSVLLVAEAVVYLALAAWCLSRSREGTWALLGGLGAALVGIALGIGAVASFQVVFFESTWLFDKVFFHAHVQLAFTVGRLAGVLLLAAGFVLSRRTPPAPASSIHGTDSAR
jgi:hypothetical protein